MQNKLTKLKRNGLNYDLLTYQKYTKNQYDDEQINLGNSQWPGKGGSDKKNSKFDEYI